MRGVAKIGRFIWGKIIVGAIFLEPTENSANKIAGICSGMLMVFFQWEYSGNIWITPAKKGI